MEQAGQHTGRAKEDARGYAEGTVVEQSGTWEGRGETLGGVDPVEALIDSEPNPFGYSDEQRRVGDAGTPITPMGPLAEGETEGTIPPSPLWAMKIHRRFQWSHLLPHGEQHDRVRLAVGQGDDLVYLMDDGHHHRVIGRHVGRTVDGASYSLVARIATDAADRLARGLLSAREAILGGKSPAVYGVVEDGPGSNVFIVTTYASTGDVPDDYLPPHAPLVFTEDLDPAD
jgi:hypothetical protein